MPKVSDSAAWEDAHGGGADRSAAWEDAHGGGADRAGTGAPPRLPCEVAIPFGSGPVGTELVAAVDGDGRRLVLRDCNGAEILTLELCANELWTAYKVRLAVGVRSNVTVGARL